MNILMKPETREQAMFIVRSTRPYTVLESIEGSRFDDVFNSMYPPLHELNGMQVQGLRNLALEYIVMAIVQAQRLLNVAPKLEDTAIRKAAGYILEDYSHLTIADLGLCMKLGIKGQLGAFYGRFDAQVVYDWFYAYNIKRDEAKRYWEAGR